MVLVIKLKKQMLEVSYNLGSEIIGDGVEAGEKNFRNRILSYYLGSEIIGGGVDAGEKTSKTDYYHTI